MDFHPSARARLARWLLVFLVLAGATATVVWWRDNHSAAKNSASNSYQTTTKPLASNDQSKAGFNKSQYSINDPASIWVVVNKGRVLPSDYVPANLVTPSMVLRLSASDPEMHVRQVVATAMEKLFAAATSGGLHLMLASGYRSYTEQVSVYGAEVQKNGQAGADQESARPGHSEHQTGLAADLEPASRNCELSVCFADTPEGKWLAANAYKYGFIIRYQKNKNSLTGYNYEPWHIRFTGADLASEINKTGQTLEQFFNLSASTDYPATSYQLKAGY